MRTATVANPPRRFRQAYRKDTNECTITGNQASRGGAVDNQNTLTINDSTITGNSATANTGGLLCPDASTTTLTGTIVADNMLSGTASDIGVSGTPTITGTHNLIGTGGSGGITNGTGGNIVLTNLATLGLAPLGDYGGPTETVALLPNSAAIGAGTAITGITIRTLAMIEIVCSQVGTGPPTK